MRCNHSQDMIWIFIDGKVCANINCEKYFEDVIESQDTEDFSQTQNFKYDMENYERRTLI